MKSRHLYNTSHSTNRRGPCYRIDEPQPGLGTEISTTANHTLIRGLNTALPFFVLAFLSLRSCIGTVACNQQAHQKLPTRVARFSAPNADCGAYSSDPRYEAWGTAVSSDVFRAIAQMKQAISRAIAVTTMFWFLPRARIARKRWHNLIWAFHAMSRISFGTPIWRFAVSVLTRAGRRYAQAPSISTRRPRAVPAFVMGPRMTRLPEECSEGDSPR